ncbi:hypothetical protein Hanom_Chr11g01043411 [Helianthus anomalus]
MLGPIMGFGWGLSAPAPARPIPEPEPMALPMVVVDVTAVALGFSILLSFLFNASKSTPISDNGFVLAGRIKRFISSIYLT